MAAGGSNLLLLDFNAGLAALADRFGFGQNDLLLLGLNVLFGFKGELVGRTHAVTDVDRTGGKDAVVFHELFVVGLAANDFASQVVEDREVRIGLEDDFDIGHARGQVRVRRHVDDTGVFMRELAVGHAAPENRVRFGHVVAPENHRVAFFDVIIDVHRFVHAEGLVEAHHGGSHAKTSVGVNVVGTEAGLQELGSRVGFGNRVLPRTDDGYAFRSLGLVDTAELAFHFVEGLFPAHGHELTVLVELAVLHAHERARQTILTVEDLGVEVALDAVQAAIDGSIRVAFRGDDAAVHRADLQTAAGTAEAADALVPFNPGIGGLSGLRARLRHGQAHRHGGGGSNPRF